MVALLPEYETWLLKYKWIYHLDLDYEVCKPFNFGCHRVVLPLEEDASADTLMKNVGNFFLASVPGHKFRADIIDEILNSPPEVTDHTQEIKVYGPDSLSAIYNRKAYEDVYTPDRAIYIPLLLNKDKDIESARNNGVSIGIHHGWGTWRKSTWKQRFTLRLSGENLKAWIRSKVYFRIILFLCPYRFQGMF